MPSTHLGSTQQTVPTSIYLTWAPHNFLPVVLNAVSRFKSYVHFLVGNLQSVLDKVMCSAEG